MWLLPHPVSLHVPFRGKVHLDLLLHQGLRVCPSESGQGDGEHAHECYSFEAALIGGSTRETEIWIICMLQVPVPSKSLVKSMVAKMHCPVTWSGSKKPGAAEMLVTGQVINYE